LANVSEIQDKRLFQCGSQEAGLVEYNKYTCTKMNLRPRVQYKTHDMK